MPTCATFSSSISPGPMVSKQSPLRAEPKACRLQGPARLTASSWMSGPDVDGREAVRILRKSGFLAPIIMLTGHNTDTDVILGFESGANDYVVKPFQFAVLLARIRAQLRQHEASEDAVFTIGHCTFNPRSKQLIDPKGCKRRLTQKETAILRYLYRAGQRPESREALLQEIWGDNPSVTTHTLETHIYRLRRKVEKDASNPSVLVTVGGAYKLLA